jgi:hypothetical protein
MSDELPEGLEELAELLSGPEIDPLAGPNGGDEGRRMAAFWKEQVDGFLKDRDLTRWRRRGDNIEKRYRDERQRGDDDATVSTGLGGRKYNSLWANVQVLQPALYGRCPLPIAERRFHDKDVTGRAAAQMLERGLRNEIEICGYHDAMTQVVQDYLLPGLGTGWVRYEPEVGSSPLIPPDDYMDLTDSQGAIDPDDDPSFGPLKAEEGEDPTSEQGDAKLAQTDNRIIRESVPVDYINWRDFFFFPAKARTWAEVVAVGKRVYMTRNQLKERFGPEIGEEIPLLPDNRDETRRKPFTPSTNQDDKAQVFEIWNKTESEVYWIAEGYQYLCDKKDDPLRLTGFFPCPKPLLANPTTGTLVPVADYMQYQDQAIQVDELTARIAMLAKACKVAGVYNSAARSIRRLLDETVENELIPVDDWAAFAEKGGVAGNISLLPLKEIMGVINELMMMKERQIQEMDRLTGINDIMRGTSDARETLGGVRLKSNNTGTRLTARQNEVARYAKDLICLIAEVMCVHFSPKSLIDVSGALYAEGLGPTDVDNIMDMMNSPPPPPMLPPPVPPPGAAMGPPGAPVPGGPPMPPGMPPGMPPPGMMPPGMPPGMPPPGMPPMGGPQMGPMPPPPGAGPGPMPPMQGMGGPPMPPGMPPMGGPPMPPGPPGLPGQPPGGPPQGGPGGPPGMPPMGGPPGMPPGGPQGQQNMPPQMQVMLALKRIFAAIDLLRNEKLRGFRVDIEVDSTIYGDSQQEKKDRIEFLQMVTQYLQTAGAMASQFPDVAPLLGKLLQFGVRGFRVGRDLEVAIGEFVEAAPELIQAFKAQEQNKGGPEQMKMQIEQKKADAEIKNTMLEGQMSQQEHQAELQRQALEGKSEAYNATAAMQQKEADIKIQSMQIEIEKIKAEAERINALVALHTAKAQLAQPVQQESLNAPSVPPGPPAG